ncbi:MAG: ATP-binding cassette domain-containing protein [Bacteroidota bacterium]
MIEIKDISKIYSDQFGNKIKLLENVSFIIEDRKIISLIAPVGSGKSSLLKIISGLEKESSGTVKKNESGKIIYLPSGPSSFPWLTVKENIVFGLDEPNNEQINRLLSFVGLEGYAGHYPDNKSLGFRFRISLARSLAHLPECICIDEPFIRMDQSVKMEIYQLIRKVSYELNTSVLIATTNITEAIFLSDKIFLLGGEPAKIIGSLNIDLPQYRDLSVVTTQEFSFYINEVENIFKQIDSKKILFKSI